MSHNNIQERPLRPLAPAHSRGSLSHCSSDKAPPETRAGSAGDSGPAASAASERAQRSPRAAFTLRRTPPTAVATRHQASIAPTALSLPGPGAQAGRPGVASRAAGGEPPQARQPGRRQETSLLSRLWRGRDSRSMVERLHYGSVVWTEVRDSASKCELMPRLQTSSGVYFFGY